MLPPNTVMEELDTDLDDDQVQKFVWVIPVDNVQNPQFALKTYGESNFLVFRSGAAVLVPGTEVNPDHVTIFMFPNNAFN